MHFSLTAACNDDIDRVVDESLFGINQFQNPDCRRSNLYILHAKAREKWGAEFRLWSGEASDNVAVFVLGKCPKRLRGDRPTSGDI